MFLKEAFLFGGIQVLALLVSGRLARTIVPAIPLSPDEASSTLSVLATLGAAIVLLIIFSRPRWSHRLIRIMWLAAIFGGTHILLGAFLPNGIAALIAFALTLVYARAATIGFHNFMLLCALPGIGATLGNSIPPNAALVALALLSLYDVIAVYWTGHMIEMAKEFIASGIVPGIIVTMPQGASGDERETIWAHDVVPGERTAILGSGDLVIPTILETSAMNWIGLSSGILTAAGAMLGLVAMHLLFWGQKVRRPMAALPPIAAGAIAGFMLSLVLLR